MTTYKLKLNLIRQVLGMAVKLETAKLQDGAVINFEELEPGYPVFAEDGVTPLAEGEYMLEDGTSIKVDENGLISEIMPPSAEVETPAEPEAEVEQAEEAPTEETPTEEAPVEEAQPSDEIKSLTEKVDALYIMVESVVNEIEEMKTKMEKFSSQPASPKIPKVSAPEPTKLDRVESAVEFLKSVKK